LQGVERLVVAIDNDTAGHAAAAQLRARLDIDVDPAPPPDGAVDWNDWACARLQ
jgi:hypothetical protein